jgi:RNA polymerase sigma factor (sigma-70 family)
MPVTGDTESLAVRSLLRRPNLTAERERQLLRTRHASGDEAAWQQALSELWQSHAKLVLAVARQYYRPDLSMSELVGAGHLGMRAAIDGFDPDQADIRLSSYAVGWIRHYIEDYIRRRALPITPSGSPGQGQLLRSGGRLFADARRSCEREGIEPTEAELYSRVGARIGLSGDAVAQSTALALGDAPAAETSSAASEATGNGPEPDDAVILHLDHAKLRRRVAGLAQEILGERERIVFLARCIGDPRATRQRERLAAELGVNRERIYQLEVSARRKIAAALAHDGLLHPFAERGKSRVGRAQRRPAETPA